MHAKEQEQRRREEAQRIAVDGCEFLSMRRTNKKVRFEKLEATATNWERATTLRAFANATDAHARTSCEIVSEQAEWLAWVRAKADWLDSLIQASDPIFDAPEPKRPGCWESGEASQRRIWIRFEDSVLNHTLVVAFFER